MKTSDMKSIDEIDLSPKSGKQYWVNCHREWREEFIYFLMVDRFHDSNPRQTLQFGTRHSGFGNSAQLGKWCGGTIRGIIDHLDYINTLGCTALWLSPVFGNNPDTYHGYAIENYLEVDERFGSKRDLEELVERAHSLEIRVFLDIVLHHGGDNWQYPGDQDYYYNQGMEFPLDNWRYPDRPIPIELRRPEMYGRKGQIRHFDEFPETREGDFIHLKAFRNDDSQEALRVQQLLIDIHCYWIRELDVDGFRLDAVKHMGKASIRRFSSRVREYAYSLGKRNFFLFGELVGADDMANEYIGPMALTPSDRNVYYGLDSVLDFQLYYVLEGVIKGRESPEKLIERYKALQKNALRRGESGEFLVTFLDNHDQVGHDFKQRFGYDATPEQIIAGVAFLLCALGTPCLYYGTEQGLDGHGQGDRFVRESLFDPDDSTRNILNPESAIYEAIARLAKFRKENRALRFGRMFIRETSPDGIHFKLPDCDECTLAFSRVLHDQETLYVFNSSPSHPKEEYIRVGAPSGTSPRRMEPVYGLDHAVDIESTDPENGDTFFIQIHLNPMQLIILHNVQ